MQLSPEAGGARRKQRQGDKGKSAHHWPHSRGRVPAHYGTTPLVGPANLTASLAWSWSHPDGRYHTSVAGGVVIDREKNLYLGTNDGVRKFSSDGQTLWHYPPPGDTNNAVVLMDDIVFGNTNNGFAFALDIHTGKPLWVKKHGERAGLDVGYPGAHLGIYVMGIDVAQSAVGEGGNSKVLALNATDGSELWHFRVDPPVWNFMPLFPDNDSLVFMDLSGGVYRLALKDGSVVWHKPAPDSSMSFSDGGVILGANNVAYACSNFGVGQGEEGEMGMLRAYSVSDGAPLWEQELPQPCNSWPAAGHLGAEGLSVIATIGSFPGLPGTPRSPHHAGLMAFDAATGELQWQYQAPIYWRPAAKGDAEGLLDRLRFDPDHAICLPASWSAPTIAGDGTVYAGHLDGKLYAVHGPPEADYEGDAAALHRLDFPTTKGVSLSTFDAEGAFLHAGTAWAPGMMAVASCDSLFVFKLGGA